MTEPPFYADYNVPPVSKTMTSLCGCNICPEMQALKNRVHALEKDLRILAKQHDDQAEHFQIVDQKQDDQAKLLQILEEKQDNLAERQHYLEWDMHNENGNLKGKITELEMAQIDSD